MTISCSWNPVTLNLIVLMAPMRMRILPKREDHRSGVSREYQKHRILEALAAPEAKKERTMLKETLDFSKTPALPMTTIHAKR